MSDFADKLAVEGVEMGGNELTDSQHASLVAEFTRIIAERTVGRETHEALASVHSETVKVLNKRLVELAQLRKDLRNSAHLLTALEKKEAAADEFIALGKRLALDRKEMATVALTVAINHLFVTGIDVLRAQRAIRVLYAARTQVGIDDKCLVPEPVRG